MSTLTETPTFDPNSAVEAIRAKIRLALLDVIPDAQWDAMIRAEVHSFMNDATIRDQWGHARHQEAGYKKIVREALETQAKERVKALLESPEWRETHGMHGDPEASRAVQKYVTENAGLILNKWVASAVQQVVSQLSYQR